MDIIIKHLAVNRFIDRLWICRRWGIHQQGNGPSPVSQETGQEIYKQDVFFQRLEGGVG